MSKLSTYQKAEAPLPAVYTAWQIFGAGFEHVGRDGQPSTLPLRPPNDNEILLRVDALGICLSDIKIINQGSNHARLKGRDLAADPTVLGHECAATVVAVGKQWQDRFRPGERYIVQADIYYKGEGYAFGYRIPGGMAEYTYLDERALAGDEGCYLLPVKPETGYSQAALAEPWACVEMSYNLQDRIRPGANRMLVVTEDTDLWRGELPVAEVVAPDLDNLMDEDRYDDIIVAGATPALVQRLAPHLNKDGVMFILGPPAEDGPVSLDIGSIHYAGQRYLGGAATLDGLAQIHARNDLLPGGRALFIGAGGPMGQMHVQRAIEVQNSPRLIAVTDLDPGRLDHIRRRFGPLAKRKGIALHLICPEQGEKPESLNARLRAVTHDGYTDISIMAPVAALVPPALEVASDNAFVNVFAGVGIGSFADVKLGDLCRGIKIIGCSGSRIRDLRKILDMVESGQLNTNLSVAAIGGLKAGRDGLLATKEARFPGKTVIYTQIPDLPLMPIEEVPQRLPELADKLTKEGAWSREAEAALLEKFL